MPVYFRRIEVVGEVPSADVRGRLFVSNHVNGILDPILVFLTSACDISPVAKSTLWSVPVLRWLLGVVDSVRVVRRVDDPTKQGGSNDAAFEEVAAWLHRGGNILIFPEGTSHSQPHLVEIKTGAARMLRRACELGSKEALTMQSVAMEFDAREEARSRVLLIYGPVRRVADLDTASDGFIGAATEMIRADLSERLVEGATWEDRRAIGLAAEMLANEAGDRSLAGWNLAGRRLEAAKRRGGATELFERASESLTAYGKALSDLGVTDAEVAGVASFGVGRALFLAAIAPLAAIGALGYAIPRWLTNRIADRVKSKDETGTFRLGVALVFHPIWAVLCVTLSLALAPSPLCFGLAALALICPFASIPWIDASPEIGRRLRIWRAGSRLDEVKRARSAARSRVSELLGEMESERG